jgi:hypothetical protein
LFLVRLTSYQHVGGNAAIEQSSENRDAKEAAAPSGSSGGDASVAQHRVHRIVGRTFEPIPIELTVRFNVTDGRLDCTPSLDHRAKPRMTPHREPGRAAFKVAYIWCNRSIL